ncbi:hypothetical protein [Nitrospirillum sp. BR 11828]|uniref:type II toxin-antitoxin system RelB family antitoxin n=1 Tax=Nitrospirillum sp. BR 11828 TaxID=3104325 RepID=UPI002AC9F9AE|nr:hypothetical protein [Nitrospirillum sp. BR 11828]MDZ5646826.1 hypothetical protein [Nitrospirillum sp. BR 11828]
MAGGIHHQRPGEQRMAHAVIPDNTGGFDSGMAICAHFRYAWVMNALSPLVSEHETEEAAVEYDRWFRAKVRASIEDPAPSIPHDEAMARVEALLRAAEERAGLKPA